uniref:Uncharacterized protein n=1 Tax=viral metagenome TaxID=1070528 RepID=A0A6C0H5G8_9ZZZZ
MDCFIYFRRFMSYGYTDKFLYFEKVYIGTSLSRLGIYGGYGYFCDNYALKYNYNYDKIKNYNEKLNKELIEYFYHPSKIGVLWDTN